MIIILEGEILNSLTVQISSKILLHLVAFCGEFKTGNGQGTIIHPNSVLVRTSCYPKHENDVACANFPELFKRQNVGYHVEGVLT